MFLLLVYIAAVTSSAASVSDQMYLNTKCVNNSDCRPWLKCFNHTCVCKKEYFNDGLLKCTKNKISVLCCN